MAGPLTPPLTGTPPPPLARAQPPQPQQPSSPAPPAAPLSSQELLVAGLTRPLQELRELVAWPRRYAAESAALGVCWPRGLLLHGPPGCGKTLLVRAVAEECGAKLHVVSPGDVFGSYLGESERRLREAFEAAAEQAAGGDTVIVFLDEVDALCPRREGGRPHEARVVAQLLTLLDGAATVQAPPPPPPPAAAGPSATHPQTVPPGTSSHAAALAAGGAAGGGGGGGGRVVVVAATNRPSAVDPALRRPGRLDREVVVPVPDEQQRADILRLHTRALLLSPEVDLDQLAAACAGYSGADLAALVREAALAAFSHAATSWLTTRQQQQQQQVPEGGAGGMSGGDDGGEGGVVGPADFQCALTRVGPSILRGAASELHPVSWDDIGGYPHLKQRLQQVVEWPLRHADAFRRLGLTPPRGVLLHGPPGCGKTLLARAAATASRATFIALSCAQLYSMYVGEGEAMLRDTLARARQAAPAVLLLDEVDALAPGRGSGGEGEGAGEPGVGVRLLSVLLTELDGLEQPAGGAPGVLLLAATNRPAALDAALLRPGRLDVLLYVGPPDTQGRADILAQATRGMPLAADVDLGELAHSTARFTGAELAALCREAALAALREDVAGASQVAGRHFRAARAAASAALSPQELQQYEEWGKQYGR